MPPEAPFFPSRIQALGKFKRVELSATMVGSTAPFDKWGNYKAKVVASSISLYATFDLLVRYLRIIAARAESTTASFCARYGHHGDEA